MLTNARSLINSSRNNLELNVLKYPNDIDSVPHKILFRFVKRNTSQSEREFNRRNVSTNSNDFIILPVPSNIQDGVKLDYTIDNMGLTGEILSNTVRGMSNVTGANNFITEVGRSVGNTLSGLFAEGAIAQATAGGALAAGGQAISTLTRGLVNLNLDAGALNRAIAFGLGRMVNPYTTAIFNGVRLRTFNFEWIFSPSSISESRKIEEIIKKIRSKSLPKVSASSAIMYFPDEVEFTFLGMQDDTFSFPTAPCVITTFNIDRSPSGSPAFFAGSGAPAFFNISIGLMEIKPLVNTEQRSPSGANTISVSVNPSLSGAR